MTHNYFLMVQNDYLQILSKFYKLSGLKINEEKTRAIWIGAKSNSNDKLCNDYK